MPQEKNTIRQSKKLSGTSTQTYLEIAEIRDDTLILKNGGLRAILETSSVNFNLKSEQEQEAIIYSYQSFLNSLEFPIQIVVQSRKLDIDNYIVALNKKAETQTSRLMQNKKYEYIEYIRRLVEYANIMEKKIYVIITYNPYRSEKLNVFQKFWINIHPQDTVLNIQHRHKEFEELKKNLSQRVNIISSGLANCGLHINQLKTQNLIEIFYKIFNPITSKNQKLQNVFDQALQTDEEMIKAEKKEE